MSRLIEVTVSPRGEVTVQTKGYAGAACLEASRFLELALGEPASESKTGEYYQVVPADQHLTE